MDQRVRSSSQDILAEPIPGGYSPTTQQRLAVDLADTIKGWGSDLDPGTRPGVPRDKAPEIGVESLYPPIEPQVARIKIHKSNEHGQMPPVFGTSCPPKGLSGRLRDMAYRLSEGRPTRWMTLMFADRVDMVEGVLADFARLRPPNVVREMGLRSEWRYNRQRMVKAAAVAAALGAIYLLTRRKSR